MDSANLRFTGGSSDKVYQCAIEPSGDGFVVTFAYGRYGSTLRPGTKTAKPVTREKAQAIFDKLLNEKLSEGYRPQDGQAVSFAGVNGNGKQASGLLPQLLVMIDESRLEWLLANDAFVMQEKKDGERRMVRKRGAVVEGVNKKGEIVPLPEAIVTVALSWPGDFTIDGEQVGEILYAFDALEVRGVAQEPWAYEDRLLTLQILCREMVGVAIQSVPTYEGALAKRAGLDKIRAGNLMGMDGPGEGVVFKRRAAPYRAGRGDDQFKFKFYATATVRVFGNEGEKRSVTVSVGSGAGTRPMGKVTIPPNRAIPSVGDLVEVRYLYAYRDGALFQATYLGPRPDQDQADEYESLKFKTHSEDDDDPE